MTDLDDATRPPDDADRRRIRSDLDTTLFVEYGHPARIELSSALPREDG